VPGKRKAKLVDDTVMRSMARAYTETVITQLGGIATGSDSPAARVAACAQLLDRGWGRPAQTVEHGGKGTEDIRVTIRTIIEGKK
jgi:hypothetical protein